MAIIKNASTLPNGGVRNWVKKYEYYTNHSMAEARKNALLALTENVRSVRNIRDNMKGDKPYCVSYEMVVGSEVPPVITRADIDRIRLKESGLPVITKRET